uniref:Uncharacterized protein n=1 Tax=Wenling dimarhabdovirus 9 TaxID=2116362 RepID=A0A2P1GNJ3_9RHAB|nr:hypothetical protein [Wenling dimarhabdovirus 9]
MSSGQDKESIAQKITRRGPELDNYLADEVILATRTISSCGGPEVDPDPYGLEGASPESLSIALGQSGDPDQEPSQQTKPRSRRYVDQFKKLTLAGPTIQEEQMTYEGSRMVQQESRPDQDPDSGPGLFSRKLSQQSQSLFQWNTPSKIPRQSSDSPQSIFSGLSKPSAFSQEFSQEFVQEIPSDRSLESNLPQQPSAPSLPEHMSLSTTAEKLIQSTPSKCPQTLTVLRESVQSTLSLEPPRSILNKTPINPPPGDPVQFHKSAITSRLMDTTYIAKRHQQFLSEMVLIPASRTGLRRVIVGSLPSMTPLIIKYTFAVAKVARLLSQANQNSGVTGSVIAKILQVLTKVRLDRSQYDRSRIKDLSQGFMSDRNNLGPLNKEEEIILRRKIQESILIN